MRVVRTNSAGADADRRRRRASTSVMHCTSVVTIASEPVSIDYDRSFEKNRDVDVDSMLHGHVD